MGVSKTVTTILNAVTIPASSSVISTGFDLSAAIDLSLGLVIPFPSGANGNLKFEMFGDPAGANIDFTIGDYDEALDGGEVWYANNNTVNGVYPMAKAPKFAKIKVTNLGTVNITSLSAYAIIQVA